jgi:hypothetical protein
MMMIVMLSPTNSYLLLDLRGCMQGSSWWIGGGRMGGGEGGKQDLNVNPIVCVYSELRTQAVDSRNTPNKHDDG